MKIYNREKERGEMCCIKKPTRKKIEQWKKWEKGKTEQSENPHGKNPTTENSIHAQEKPHIHRRRTQTPTGEPPKPPTQEKPQNPPRTRKILKKNLIL